MNRKIITFFILFFTGVGFGIWGMCTPPDGEIHSSVLIMIAQIFILCASVYGFELHIDIQKGKFDAGKKKEDNDEE